MWERCMTSCGMNSMWRSSRRMRHTLSIRLLTGTCSQGPPRFAGFEQQRKCLKGGGEAPPGVSLPPWKRSASRKNHEEWTCTADSCSGCSSGTSDSLDASSFSQDSRSRQNAPINIPPHEASGNPWHMLLIKSPPNYEEQWQRRASPIPSRFHCWLSRSATLGAH